MTTRVMRVHGGANGSRRFGFRRLIVFAMEPVFMVVEFEQTSAIPLVGVLFHHNYLTDALRRQF